MQTYCGFRLLPIIKLVLLAMQRDAGVEHGIDV